MTPAEGSGSRPSDRRCAPDTSGIDDPGGRFRVTTLSFSHLVPKSLTHPLPHAVLRPTHVVAVDGVPVRVVGRQCPPLTSRRRYVEDGVHDVALVLLGGASHATVPRVGGDQIGDQFPLLIGQVTLGGPRSSQWVCPWIPSLKSMGFDHPKEDYSS